MDNTSYVRCKACNLPFHPCWRDELLEFEDLCYICIPASRELDYDEEQHYLKGLVLGSGQISGSDLDDDPYHEHGPDAFGNINLLDNH